ncbi:hypothetical protein KXD40_009574 [Peronospora effusa]|nr:hypothetical protein KXD40_009574 [Peronospora effusa]
MRLPCVPILLAVATRPVGVGARTEPSDVVTTVGQVGIRRHLRVQERTHDEDEEERMKANFGVEAYIPKSKFPTTFSELRPHDITAGAQGTIHPNERVNLEADQNGKLALRAILSRYEQNALPMIRKQLNNRLSEKLQNIFYVHGLNLAGDNLFLQPSLADWVQYVDKFNAGLLYELQKFYTIDNLVVAVTMAPEDKVALRVESEIDKLWFNEHKTPDAIFTQFKLHEAKDTLFDNQLFPFWERYYTYYNSMVPETFKASMYLIVGNHLRSFREKLLDKKKTDVTSLFEEEIKKLQLEVWTLDGTLDDIVRHEVESGPKSDTVYGSALKNAADEYLPKNP